MKFTKYLIVMLSVAAVCISTARAQNDIFNTVRTANIGSVSAIGIGGLPATNGPVDILGYNGRGVVLLTTFTNGIGGGNLYAAVETSPDTTNWTQLANYAVITSPTSISYTNTGYAGANLVVADNFLLPGTITTPTAYSAGFNTPDLATLMFTNTGTVNVSKNGNYAIGINLTDSARYIHVVWTGSATNGTTVVNAVVQGGRFLAP
jgi:hypothetical protein